MGGGEADRVGGRPDDERRAASVEAARAVHVGDDAGVAGGEEPPQRAVGIAVVAERAGLGAPAQRAARRAGSTLTTVAPASPRSLVQ